MKIARCALCFAWLLMLSSPVSGMIYKPKSGAMWDPSVIWHQGKYYAFMMHCKAGDKSYGHCLLASSRDGVHWEDEGAVLEERDHARGMQFFKCFVARCGDRFIMDHGVARDKGQDILRFYESQDLKHWNYLFSNQPDPHWYGVAGQPHRWDHMYILPKDEGHPQSGYWGYPVAIPRSKLPRSPGMMQSRDGRAWEILPPPVMDWGRTPQRDLEIGGCERFGGKYYMIGGTGDGKGYSMFTLVADDARGPFRPDVEAHRLCGTTSRCVTWLAAWARCNGELLISNYASLPSSSQDPAMLPLRKPVLDHGHLRLGWWQGNERLKGGPLPLGKEQLTLPGHAADGYEIARLDATPDLKKGLLLEGGLPPTVPAANGDHGVGFVFDKGAGQKTALLLDVGSPDERESRIGPLALTADGKHVFRAEESTGKGWATVRGIAPGREYAFRLLGAPRFLRALHR